MKKCLRTVKRSHPINTLIRVLTVTFICLTTLVQHSETHWVAQNVAEIKRRLASVGVESSMPRVKNVVLFVGDGMGVSTLTAARIYKHQRDPHLGGSATLVWDDFLALAHIKTATANTQIGESAACATAMFTGVKANAEVIGFDARTEFGQCNTSRPGNRLSTIFDWAQQAGMKTGFVTTTRVTHATPAALYAHASNRYWEEDSKIPVSQRKWCKDITRQLLESVPGRNINVVMGGGRRSFLPNAALNANQTARKHSGRRLDGRNLIYEWIREKQKSNKLAQYVTTRSEMLQISNETDFVLGLFAHSHLSFHTDRHRDPETREHPSLAEMTEAAVKVLSRDPEKGFVLVVESGRIDHAHHHNNAFRALDETLALEEAVRATLRSPLINLHETLVIVTADHGEGMVFSGYSTPLDSDIFGVDKQHSDVDLKYYPVLTYAAGPGHYSYQRNMHPKDTVQPATIPKSWGNHGGEDVPLFAIGPLSTLLFSGTVDQTYIPQAISFALCISIHADRCKLMNELSQPLISVDNNNIRPDFSDIATDSIILDEFFNISTNAQSLSNGCCNLSSIKTLVVGLVTMMLQFSIFYWPD